MRIIIIVAGANDGHILIGNLLEKMGPNVDMKILKDHVLTMLVTVSFFT